MTFAQNPGYDAIHERLKAARGPAKNYTCAACAEQAQHWAHLPGDPDERIGTKRGFDVPMSVDLGFYLPLCRSCHRSLDARQ